MNGTLNLYCLDCGRFVEWRKLMIYREDAYTDWRLAVWCGCGDVTDERIMAQARAAYDEAIGAELDNSHQNYFDAALTRSGNLYFETLTGMGSGRNRSNPCRPSSDQSDPTDPSEVFLV